MLLTSVWWGLAATPAFGLVLKRGICLSGLLTKVFDSDFAAWPTSSPLQPTGRHAHSWCGSGLEKQPLTPELHGLEYVSLVPLDPLPAKAHWLRTSAAAQLA